MSQKRGGHFNHYGGDRGDSFNKKHKRNDAHFPNSALYNDRDRNGYGNRNHYAGANPQTRTGVKDQISNTLDYMSRLPEPDKCQPCKLATAELQTGLIAMLDKLAAEELAPEGDRDILHHARELNRLLSSRANASLPSKNKRALDEKRPDKEKYVLVPAYVDQKIKQVKDLPPLPTITEPYLQQAVFTHNSYNADTRAKGTHADAINYERLEFLGDAYIELIASRLLYSRFPHIDVPQQSYFREQLVRNETLGKFSEAYGLPDRLKHGGHIKESKAWTKIIADVFEAYVAGVVLSDPENGFTAAEEWLTELWAPQLLTYKEKVIENPRARDEIQGKLLMKGVKLDYREEKPMVHVNGVQKYFMGLYLTGYGYENEWLGSGEAQNKAQACIAAATDALSRDSEVMKVGIAKKQELVQEKKREREEEEKKKAEMKQGEDGYEDGNKVGDPKGEKRDRSPNGEIVTPEKKKKKSKKEKKEKRRKETSDNDSS